MDDKRIDVLWDDDPVDITQEANFIWSIANKLRGTYMPDKYADVIIPMTVLRRFECSLAPTKDKVLEKFQTNPNYPAKALANLAGLQFYCTSPYTLKELLNDTDNLAENFSAYLEGFSSNVHEILKLLSLPEHIRKMDEGGCLLSVVKAFSELDLDPRTVDPIKMGYIFENLIGRFFQNVDAGQFYTGRDIIKLLVSILVSEGCDDIFDDHKVITVCDQACGTGGMLSTAHSYLTRLNSTADVRLFGQEYNPVSYAVGLAEMLIKGQDSNNFRHTDTFKEDCFPETKMRFVIENPPFGTPWSGADAKDGQEEAVKTEFAKRSTGHSRWGAGLPSGGDSQLIFLQSAIDKMDPRVGRAAIIENGSPLFTGGTSSGESQIRRWLLENDLIEAIIALPVDLFYNTGIQTYVWILSKNKREARKGKIQLINAAGIFHKLRKALGNKKNEFSADDRKRITELYANFEEDSEGLVKIYDNEEFIYREYTVMQPYQRSYAITEERIESMLASGALSNLYDEGKVFQLENSDKPLTDKDKKKLAAYKENHKRYLALIEILRNNASDKVYMSEDAFFPVIKGFLKDYEKEVIDSVIAGLSKMDKKAEIKLDKHGEIVYDKETKDIEIVNIREDINVYMEREVLPHVPDARAFFEENLASKNPVIKTGAEIPFTRYFYKYQIPESSESLAEKFKEIEAEVQKRIKALF